MLPLRAPGPRRRQPRTGTRIRSRLSTRLPFWRTIPASRPVGTAGVAARLATIARLAGLLLWPERLFFLLERLLLRSEWFPVRFAVPFRPLATISRLK